MRTIYKYPVKISDSFDLELPIATQILAFQVQHGEPTIWALVETEREKETRHFSIRGTGNPIESDINKDIYIGTIQLSPFVWHLFEKIE